MGYPCKGADCSLCVPHPPITSSNGEGAVRSFVLGCTACQGAVDANEIDCDTSHLPHRGWNNFRGGDVLLAALGEKEVRLHLQHNHASAVQSGSAVECAERLLLLETNVNQPELLLKSVETADSNGLGILQRRLKAVGLSTDGDVFACARRLVLVRNESVATLAVGQSSPEDDELPPLEDLCDNAINTNPRVTPMLPSDVASDGAWRLRTAVLFGLTCAILAALLSYRLQI